MLRNTLQVSSVNYEYLPYTSATRMVQTPPSFSSFERIPFLSVSKWQVGSLEITGAKTFKFALVKSPIALRNGDEKGSHAQTFAVKMRPLPK